MSRLTPDSSQCRLSVDLPRYLAERLAPTPTEAADCLKQLALIELVRRGEISSGKAAELLGLDKWDFIQVLAEHGAPYFRQTPEELREEIEVATRLSSHLDKPSSPTRDR
jgi:predicted HTH domain antitoxin